MDITATGGAWGKTQCTFTAVSENAKKAIQEKYGFAVCAVTVKKSGSGEFAAWAMVNRLQIQWLE